MGAFTIIRGVDIEDVLATNTRQYLAGNLKRPQELPFVLDERVELGITSYSVHASELPHRHSEALELQYVLSGWTQYLDAETGETYDFFKGDFFAIHAGTSYVQRSKPGTRILFVKVPSIDDKELVAYGPQIAEWMAEELRSARSDYWHDPEAPAANSIKPAAAVAIVNEAEEILLLRRRDSGKWTMPGGTQEYGESLPECAVREVREEAGLAVAITNIVGTYTDPDVRIAYSDGEVRQEFTVVYMGRVLSGEVTFDDESLGYQWVPLPEAPDLPMADSQRLRVGDVATFLRSGEQQCR